ncbi:MAG: lysophospholipid acyltransferase family protein [Thermoanaerobaculia bacterium]
MSFANERVRSTGSPLRTFGATVTGNLYLVLGTLFFSLVSILVAPIPPRGNWTNRAARMWAKGLLAASWIRLEVKNAPSPGTGAGAGAEAAGDRFVIMANHQSLFDIPALLAAIPGQSRFVAKRSLFKIPIFGWAMSLGGFIPVDRKDRSTARDSFSSALDKLSRGSSIVLFPEETRSLDGRVLPFRRGGFLMALKSGLPIVPVGIDGTLEVQSRRSFLIRPRKVTVHFGEMIPLAGRSVRDLGAITAGVQEQVARLAGKECSAAEEDGPLSEGSRTKERKAEQ